MRRTQAAPPNRQEPIEVLRHLVDTSQTSPRGGVSCPSKRRSQGRPRTHWRDYISWLAMESLGTPLVELVEDGRGQPGLP